MERHTIEFFNNFIQPNMKHIPIRNTNEIVFGYAMDGYIIKNFNDWERYCNKYSKALKYAIEHKHDLLVGCSYTTVIEHGIRKQIPPYTNMADNLAKAQKISYEMASMICNSISL